MGKLLQLICMATGFTTSLDARAAERAPCSAARACLGRALILKWLRRLHWYVAAAATVLFLLIVATGLLIEHRDLFRLDEKTIGRAWLPADYRPHDPGDGVRADIVVTDLHSGRIFGPQGRLLVDGATAAWVLLIISGYGLKLLGWRSARKRTDKET
ncbi:MAG: hypothetical protein HYS04_15285 [Acidobacteria bacterium]|nr:hypothetical protein [Acidobacteriota bacterium]